MTSTIYFANPEQASPFAMLVEGDVTEVRGPFPFVEGSRWRIMIDEADLTAWRDAGCPEDRSYRDALVTHP